ncbi:TPA: YnfU family zinc-binding protein [Citrobacter braakii]|uniref:YnfU family zinc-binding protein n=1 Tax=Citrobacter braakii TaxID=57706 RepID=UPI003B874C96
MSILKDIKMRTLRPVKSTCPHCCRQSMHSLSRIKKQHNVSLPQLRQYLPSFPKQTSQVT